jgi:polar amino acid transport system substrate-binding protein
MQLINKWLCASALVLLPMLAVAETLTAVGDPWPPFLDPSQAKQGVATEIAKAAFATQGYDFELKFMPWQRAIDGVSHGEFDMLIGTWKTPERENFLAFSEPYAVNDLKFIKRKGDSFEFVDLNSLTGKKVGVVRGYGYSEAFLQASNFKREETPTLISNLLKLVNQRIDLTLEDELVARNIISKEQPQLLEAIEFVSPPISSNALHVSSGLKNPKHAAIIAAFNQGLATIKENGQLAEILQRNGMQ